MVLTVDDKILANTATNPVVINLENDRYKAVVPEDNVGVSINDSYHVMPWAKRITVDYDLPEYLTQGVLVDIDQLRADLLFEVAGRELAFVAATDYAKSYTDGVSSQIYTDLNANYVSNTDAQAYILKTELAALQITYDTGSGLTTASFQELNDTVVAVENAQASYTEDLNIHVSNTAALAERTTILEAGGGDVTVSIVGVDSIQIDPLGTYTALASKLIVGPAGDITGWSATSAQDPTLPYPSSDFIISADVFKVSNGTTKYSPMTVNTVDGTVDFAANVRFTGLGLRGDSTEIDGGLLTTNTVQADRLKAGTTGATVWTGGGLVSSDFDGNAYGDIGVPTVGFRLSSNAADTFTDPSIYGAYIRGGTVYGTTMISSTIRVKDLIVLTDADKPTSSVIATTPVITSASDVFTFTFNLYSYNSSDITNNRFATASNNPMQVLGTAEGANMYLLRMPSDGYANRPFTATVSVYRGGALLGTFSSSNGSSTIAGLTFTVIQSTVDSFSTCHLYIASFNLPALTGDGQLKIVCSIKDYLSYSNAVAMPITSIVTNI